MAIERDLRIDFFRGFALIFIFWDHVPQNPLGYLTLRNIGFSDAAELFVFLAGYASAVAYGRVLRERGWLVACVRVWRRAWVLYVVHIFLLAVLMGIVIVANQHVETRDLVQQMNLGYFLDNPQQALVDELLLRFKPNLMDPLPLYIVLLMGFALLLPALVRWPLAVTALAIVPYLCANLLGWNLAAQEGGLWYFNPLAWQLLFVAGAATAVRSAQPRAAGDRPWWRLPLLTLAVLCVMFGAVATVTSHWPELHESLLPQRLRELMYPVSKTDLAPLRLLNFLALAYCCARWLPAGTWLNHGAARQLRCMGRYSLELFCFGVLLAPLADVANALADDSLGMQIASALAGMVLMAALANWLELNRRFDRPLVASPTP